MKADVGTAVKWNKHHMKQLVRQVKTVGYKVSYSLNGCNILFTMFSHP